MSVHTAACAIACVAAFLATSWLLARLDSCIILYPDTHPNRTYVDDDGQRYVYRKDILVGGFTPSRP